MIELVNISKSYKEHQVLENLSVTIKQNEMVAIVGASGCGKSTLLNILGQLDQVDKGTYLYKGKNYTKKNVNRRNKSLRHEVSYLFQNYALMNNKSVEENLKVALYYSKENKEERITQVLSLVGMEDVRKYKISMLSGGEQQRIAIARLFLKDSEVILADEPTGNLDEENASMVFNLLQTLNQQGKSVVVVTHDERYLHYFDQVIRL